jgi:hypothetical protein
MEFLALVTVLVMGLVLGWMLGLDSGKKSVQGLEKGLVLEKAKAKVRELVLEQG